jgi:hypothetical protein
MHSDPSLPQTPPSFSQGPGPVPASKWANGGEFRLALEGALDQIILNRNRGESMPDPPLTAARGRARRGSSLSSNTALGFSPTGASLPTRPVLDFPPDPPLRRNGAAAGQVRRGAGRHPR